jgi:hypothetical protein
LVFTFALKKILKIVLFLRVQIRYYTWPSDLKGLRRISKLRCGTEEGIIGNSRMPRQSDDTWNVARLEKPLGRQLGRPPKRRV